MKTFNIATRLAMVVAFSMASTAASQAQMEESGPARMENPGANLDAICFSSGDSTNSHLDVYIQVPYDQMSFIKTKNSYTAQYEVTADILDENENLVVEKTWTDRAVTDSFDVSVSPQYYMMSTRSFALKPGVYTLRINFIDLDSKHGIRESRRIRIPDFYHRLTELSDIMLVSKISMDGDKRLLTPNISGNVGNLENGFHIFFEYYPTVVPDSVEFKYSFLTQKGEAIYSGVSARKADAKIMQVFIKLDSVDVPPGDYTLKLESRTIVPEGTPSIVSATQHHLAVHWRGMPVSVTNVDDAIAQLRYIAKDTELDSLEKAVTLKEKQERFVEFWKKRDPTPGTERNELMEEYYSRVDYANKRFTRYRPGWKTDMGMIYIIFGPPNNVERHPFEMDSKPYEVWSYYDIRQQLVFVDETGFGDYRLQNLDWEIWKYLPHQ